MQKRMASALAIAALFVGAADVAKAGGTTAGTTISNTATVNYSVNAVAQPAITSAAADFVVDRKIDLTLTRVPASYVNVTPATNGVIAFTIVNTSNAPLNFALAAANNPTDPFGGTDNFDPTTTNVFVDANGNGTYEPATDTATVVDTLAPDQAPLTLFVVSAIPGGQAGGSIAAVTLTAAAHETTANGGALVTQSAGADVAATMQTVFADGAGATDLVRDGAYSQTGAFLVQGATVAVVKTETVISDPINGVTNPKHIPGAIVQYQVTVTNSASGPSALPATSVSVTDVMPANVTFQPDTYAVGSGINLGGAPQTNATGDDQGQFSANTVTVTIPSLAPGASEVITFRVAVN